ncbi:helix-turn-helix transcriptional regulator [Ohtaekwangia koreensis]|uniref:Predicted DNA-binding transcriptional regulator YafY, contains an HTH and WYL domains n=1 Tax=Ohtaekwangia koreensis TaxID=688867 RepID=A0A1T5L856_9BACT|nr:WYL domain-containing protein [Ohtaekwangia koreensis]SKC72236.1 Predicted DNA-binding transcriptional regulator YafY, contains an HTH and WYL domains [Ohtaekwangia koreensis]
MPVTKSQDLRIEILDELLDARKWTFQELLDRVNQRLGDSQPFISKRTLLRDLNYLIDKKDAPIHRPEKSDNFYYYTRKFSLKNIPIDEDDLASLKNAIQILKAVDNFTLSQDVEYITRKLENRINVETYDQQIYIQFERHTTSQGGEYIYELLEAIKSKNVLRLSYQPYTHPQPSEKNVHPYLLKEFRNRWFLIGREENASRITIYALDRIKRIRPSSVSYVENTLFNPSDYFNNLIGVSIPENAIPEKVEIKVYKHAKPYVLSKPIHLNQEVVRYFKDGSMLIHLNLILNYELKSVLLSYGDGLEIRRPILLREELKKTIMGMAEFY